ncbi:MAG: S46 family peptidase [bacterium]
MKRRFIIFLLLCMNGLVSLADEGMWIPALLEKLNIRKMQEMGLKLSAEEIFSVNSNCLKDAIVLFGGGCTGGIVSAQGLILTNHHCGYGSIQRLSTLEHDYLTNGFWAPTMGDEISCPGLTVTLMVRMEEVTGKVLNGITESTDQQNRAKIIKQNSEAIEKEAAQGTGYEVKVRSFFAGNQFFLIFNEVFKDIRFVGAPPSAVGNFGGDTDNWMWPRHTGDFSVFRIYAGKDNKPSAYSIENVPYKPKWFLPISLKGYEKGDFTFVLGYPANTREYIPADGVDLIAFKEDPLRIGLRQKRLDIIRTAMESDPLIRLQYASKAASIANAWKKMIGESRGIRLQSGVARKREFEQTFQAWAESDPVLKQKYGSLLQAFQKVYKDFTPADLSGYFITEGVFGIEVIRYANGFERLEKLCASKTVKEEDLRKELAGIVKSTRDFFRNYNAGVDQQLMSAMLSETGRNMDKQYLPDIFGEIKEKFHDNYNEYAAYLFGHSFLVDSCGVFAFLNSFKRSGIKELKKDPVYRLSQSIYRTYQKQMQLVIAGYNAKIDSLQRIYMAGQMEMAGSITLYPDANSTFRIAFGRVNDLAPADAVAYRHFTTLTGMMQKQDDAVSDYAVDPKLKELYEKQDYGRFADKDGTMHIAFIAGNHTSGGNSGSPVLDEDGKLIGINFDRNWEGTQSDLMYDPSQCRNISLDIRYCLFIIDKLGGATRLIEEMQIAE